MFEVWLLALPERISFLRSLRISLACEVADCDPLILGGFCLSQLGLFWLFIGKILRPELVTNTLISTSYIRRGGQKAD